ncbi:hypothetical protein BO70DRAFT_393687 [Aspergillus heteromorphus CBS 117.55]|uniref:F-box domain-containing protein n=1 Tax=Aspergillus heteromorphus CBS 117.55 TaxID=1448321 RepID=A0A317WVC6_9EURO|nr:uncharacterized protein BO70DRAFT_393687 [Aspergillus heteromorphus CBS 117.55]PWY89177.1 hypothetical protein BO70DRAFT_393687 [Aspergillus heteromorphus CBS 117.55]
MSPAATPPKTPVSMQAEHCIICGVSIGIQDTNLTRIRCFETKPVERKHIRLYPAAELEKAYFRNHPYRWISLYRLSGISASFILYSLKFQRRTSLTGDRILVIYNPDLNEWTLSGIGSRHPEREVGYVPWDPTAALIDQNIVTPTEDLMEVRKWALKQDSDTVLGFPVHMHCWTMTEVVLGDVLEQHFDALCRILRQQWTAYRKGWDMQYIQRQLWHQTWGSGFAWLRPGLYSKGEKGKTCCTPFLTFYFLVPSEPLTRRIVNDPLRICAIKRTLRDDQNRKPRKKTQPPPVQPVASPAFFFPWMSLSVEIQMLVLEYLTDNDIDNLRTASRHAVPDYYWRHVARKALKFGRAHDEGKRRDWEYVWGRLRRSYEHADKEEWMNHARIAGFLGKIKAELWRSLRPGTWEGTRVE